MQANLFLASTRAYRMPSSSMDPTIESGDRLVANMRAYKNKDPMRGDLVVFAYPPDETVTYIKRVIGLPKEKVEVIGRVVHVNEQPLHEEYTKFIDPGSGKEHWGPYYLKCDEYLVLGDNRDNSQDSRYWGPVKRRQILGQASYLYWPSNKSRIGLALR
jgi:signal peptidase I